MKRPTTALFLLLPVWANAQGSSNSLLWSISGNGPERSGYVYGTVHSKDDRAYTFVHAVEEAMHGVNTVAGELDLNASRDNALSMMGKMMLPDGKRLEDLYKKKDWVVVDAYLKAEMGFMAPMAQRMKPFFVMATLTETIMGGSRPKVLDDHLMKHAKANAHRTIGLESVDEQLRAMDALPIKEQAAMLLEHVKQDGNRGELDRMLDAYTQQDLAMLVAITEESGTMPKALERSLLTDRNAVMAHRMDSVLRADASALFLIGAAHLPGEAGVLHLLRGLGYSVEPVVIAADEDLPLPFGPPMLLGSGIHYVNEELRFGVDMYGIPNAGSNIDTKEHFIVSNDEERGGAVFVIFKPAEQEPDDLDKALQRSFPTDKEDEVRRLQVQGIDARHALTRMDEQETEVLFMRKEPHICTLVVVDPDPEQRKRILDSFRFTDLPE